MSTNQSRNVAVHAENSIYTGLRTGMFIFEKATKKRRKRNEPRDEGGDGVAQALEGFSQGIF